MLSREHLADDLRAGVVVFLVALPLCLGIALASGAPLFRGLIAGISGGIVVSLVSQSRHGVSGPAAGLAVMVYAVVVPGPPGSDPKNTSQRLARVAYGCTPNATHVARATTNKTATH